jgi:hypothetical protein
MSSSRFIGGSDPLPADQDAILLRLNDHLEALSQGFGVSEPVAQLPLFPAVGLRRSKAPADTEGSTVLRTVEGDAA